MQSKIVLERNTEIEQSLLRIIVVTILTSYTTLLAARSQLPAEIGYWSIIASSSYLLVAIFMFFAVTFEFVNASLRRIAGMCCDIAMVTVGIHSLSEYGVPLFAFYLWISIGNGFRFGVAYLLISTILSIIAFSILSVYTPYWKAESAFEWLGFLLLTIVPAYFFVLLRRLQFEKIRAQAANIEKTRFLANISHELRTPLNAIVGFSGLMGNSMDEGQKVQLTRRIQDASSSLLALVEEVLDFSRIEAGHVELVDEDVNIFPFADTIRGMFESQAQKKNIRLVLDVSPAVGPVITVDKQRLRQILVNLVGNAVKFTSQGQVIIRIDSTVKDTVPVLQFEVIDSGEGIPTEIQAHIFDRFQQADNSVSRRHGGTGLGTAIAKHLVELMGGEIGLESEPGRGSRFWLQIPLRIADAGREEFPLFPEGARVFVVTNEPGNPRRIEYALDVQEHHPIMAESVTGDQVETLTAAYSDACCLIVDCAAFPPAKVKRLGSLGRQENIFCIAYAEEVQDRVSMLASGYHQVVRNSNELLNSLVQVAGSMATGVRESQGSDLTASDGHARRILVVEDSEMNRQVMKGILEYKGLDVNFADSGIKALKRLKEEVFDLLIVDIQMPGMSGFEVISRYKSQLPGMSRIPIVVVTGDVTKDVQEECTALGVDRFLAKPVQSERLRGVVCELLAG